MSTPEIRVERVFVTPERAKALLHGNKSNRKIQRTLVDRYVDQMKKGQWQEDTGETIALAPNGRLLNGQHRLNAIISYGKGFHFLIVHNVDETAFTVIDTGKKRNASDAFLIAGVSDATAIAGGISAYLVLRKGKITNGRRKPGIHISNDDIMNEFNSRPNFWNNIVSKSLSFYKSFNRNLSPSLIIGWYALFNDISPDKADDFMSKLCTGVGLTSTLNPVSQLRAILEKSKLSFGKKLQDYEKTAFIIKAWNDYVSGTQKILKFDTKDTFPKLSLKKLNITDDDALTIV